MVTKFLNLPSTKTLHPLTKFNMMRYLTKVFVIQNNKWLTFCLARDNKFSKFQEYMEQIGRSIRFLLSLRNVKLNLIPTITLSWEIEFRHIDPKRITEELWK